MKLTRIPMAKCRQCEGTGYVTLASTNDEGVIRVTVRECECVEYRAKPASKARP